MIVNAVKTEVVVPGSGNLVDLLDKHLPRLSEGSILVITSKIIALLEGRVVDGTTSRDELVHREADYVLPEKFKDNYIPLTIKDNTLIPAAGIDKSNSDGKYVLWPRDSQVTANEVRTYLRNRFGLKKVGVIVTDSSAMPLRFGTIGIPIAYSGFDPFHEYQGQKDLFGHSLKAGKANLAGGLAAAAVTVMGEGTEQTPLAVISDIEFVDFKDQNPDEQELRQYFVSMEKDRLFAPFFSGIEWEPTKENR